MSPRAAEVFRLLAQLVELELESSEERIAARVAERLQTPAGRRGEVAKLLSIDDAAKRLRCSRRKVSRLIATGRLRAVKLEQSGSSRVSIPSESVEALIAESVT